MKFEEEPIPDFELARGECSSPKPLEDVSDDTCSVFSYISKYDIFYMNHHQGSSGMKKSFKLLGNWQEIPMSLGRLDHKLVVLPLQVIVLLLSTVIW